MVRRFFKLIKLVIFLAIVGIAINVYVVKSTENKIAASIDNHVDAVTLDEKVALGPFGAECIMVLGASVNPDGTPSPMLADRLDAGITLYKEGFASKMLLSGDNGQKYYDEVSVMKNYAVEAGVAEEDIFLDHAGFSTYESVYRASEIFGVEKMIVVTQKYHLFRALYGCKMKGVEALGVAANQEAYAGREYREVREVLARNKDFIKWFIKPEPTFLGDEIPVNGNGIKTHE